MQVVKYSPSLIRIRILLPVLAAVVMACLFAVPVLAHSPTHMVLSFDPDSDKLSVTITHPVDDPTTHYVTGVQVLVNGIIVSDPQYKSQPTKDTFTYTYDVSGRPGDSIRVIAPCVLGGLIEKTYEIPVPEHATTLVTPSTQVTMISQGTPVSQITPVSQGTPVPTRTQKSSLGLAPLFGAAAVLLIRKL
jgi:hypothetical protein